MVINLDEGESLTIVMSELFNISVDVFNYCCSSPHNPVVDDAGFFESVATGSLNNTPFAPTITLYGVAQNARNMQYATARSVSAQTKDILSLPMAIPRLSYFPDSGYFGKIVYDLLTYQYHETLNLEFRIIQ